MINPEELRINNLVFAVWAEQFVAGSHYLKIDSFNKDGINSLVYLPEINFDEEISTTFEYLTPIELSKFWKSTLRANYDYPEHIKYVHQLQNWHYLKYNQEISLDKLVFEEDALNLNPKKLLRQMQEYEAEEKHPKLF